MPTSIITAMTDFDESVDTMLGTELSGTSNSIDTITLTSSPYIFSNTVSAPNPTITISTISPGASSLTNGWPTGTSPMVVGTEGLLSIKGKNADIDINGVSLMKTLTSIQERLNILTPAPELEKDWDRLRELGEQYRKLETEFEEKSKMWKTLKAMPPPEIK